MEGEQNDGPTTRKNERMTRQNTFHNLGEPKFVAETLAFDQFILSKKTQLKTKNHFKDSQSQRTFGG